MWEELQCLFFTTALIYTKIKLFFFFFAVGTARSEYRFEVTPKLELLFLKLSI